MSDLEKRLSRMADIQEIEQLLNRYVYMLVTMDFDNIFDECFSQTREDVSIQASDSGVYIGKEHIKDFLNLPGHSGTDIVDGVLVLLGFGKEYIGGNHI